MEGKEAPADGVVTGYGKVDGRLVAVAAYDFTVMAGSMGMTGEMKVTRLRELALTKRIPMSGCSTRRARASRRPAGSLFAGSGHLFREEVIDERRGAAGGRADGPVRGGHRVHPRARRLRADGQGARLDGAGRAASHQGRDGRGRDAGGARRLAHPHAHVRRGRPRGGVRRGLHRARSRTTSPTSRRTARSRRRCASPRTRWTGWTRSCSTSSPTRRASRTTCTT